MKKILWLMAANAAMSMGKVVMKKYIIVLAAMVMVIFMVSGAYATGSATPSVSLSATIATTCVVGGSGTMAFGSLDANINSGVNTTPSMSGMTLWCTKGDSVTFAVGQGLHFATTNNLQDSGTNKIPYTVSLTTPVVGLGKSDTTTMVTTLALKATIAAGALNDVPAGSYGDTVVLTITY